MTEKDTDKQQQETLSLRISRALRKRLERIRDVAARGSGEYVSISEVAKQLLESAHGDHLNDRIELSELLNDPTTSLRNIRKQCEANQHLSRAQWNILASYVQKGDEAVSTHRISRQSSIAILEAFLAVYQLRKGASERDRYFLDYLPSHRAWDQEDQENDTKPTPENIQKAVAWAIQQLKDPARKLRLPMIARTLQVAVDEDVSRLDQLNQALFPYWKSLWQVAARGHYLQTKKPIRENPDFELTDVHELVVPSVQEGDFSLDFAWDRHDFDALLSFPKQRGAMYAFGGYPRLLEFRALLDAFDPQALPDRAWRKDYFFAYPVKREQRPEVSVRFIGQGVTFRFFLEEWRIVREIFQRAWANPELQMIWERMAMEYGEL